MRLPALKHLLGAVQSLAVVIYAFAVEVAKANPSL